MSNVIDALTESVRKFGVSQDTNTFNTELDFIMTKIKKVDLDNEDIHWEHLQSDYSKMKYLYELINFYNVPTGNKFRESLKKFMDSIEARVQYYLSEINWYDTVPELRDDTIRIKDFFEESLNQNDSILKLEAVIKGYQILVPIVEDFRNEKISNEIDRVFLDEFQRPPKRAKY